MKEKKYSMLTAVIYIIVFAVYNLIVFMVFRDKTNVFWLSYAFMAAAFAAQIISLALSIRRNATIETIFFGIPLVSLSVFYLFAELFCSLVFMIFQTVGINVALVVQVVLFAAFVVIAIIALMARDVVQQMDKDIKTKVSALKSLVADVEMLMQKEGDPELKNKLRKLSETIKYSDPMTNPSIEDMELMIMQKFTELRYYCDAQMAPEGKKACSELELLFIERNKKLLISK